MTRRALPGVALVAILAAGWAVPVHAKPHGEGKNLRNEGCIAVGTHQIAFPGMRPWDCYFTATGPSAFVATTPGAFVISVSKDDGMTWKDVVRRASAGPPTVGMVPTAPGDLVGVSISCWDYTSGSYCRDAFGGRFGIVAVHSRL